MSRRAKLARILNAMLQRKPIKQIAREENVNVKTLYRWIKQPIWRLLHPPK